MAHSKGSKGAKESRGEWGRCPVGYNSGYKRRPLCSISDRGKVENASVLDYSRASWESEACCQCSAAVLLLLQLPPSLVNSRHSSKHVVVKL